MSITIHPQTLAQAMVMMEGMRPQSQAKAIMEGKVTLTLNTLNHSPNPNPNPKPNPNPNPKFQPLALP
jgi:hypothetical protein